MEDEIEWKSVGDGRRKAEWKGLELTIYSVYHGQRSYRIVSENHGFVAEGDLPFRNLSSDPFEAIAFFACVEGIAKSLVDYLPEVE